MERLLEYNRKDLRAKYGDEVAAKFFDNRSRYPSPQNDLDYWMKNDGLEDFMNNFKSKTQKAKDERTAGAEKIYEDENWQVLHLTTYAAAAQYGKGSKWCICGNYPRPRN